MNEYGLVMIAVGLFVVISPEILRSLRSEGSASIQSAGLVWFLKNLVFEIRVGQSLSLAILNTDTTRVPSIPYIARLRDCLMDRHSLYEASRSLRHLEFSSAERLVEGVFQIPGSSPQALQSGLESLVDFFSVVARHVRQEKARTAQSRFQFLIVACLIPLLFTFNLIIVPDLVLFSIRDAVGFALYGVAIIVYLLSILIFLRLQGRSFSFLYEIQSGSAVAGRRPSMIDAWKNPLQKLCKKICELDRSVSVSEQTKRLGILCAIEMAARTGVGARRSLEIAVASFPDSVLARSLSQILEREARGDTLQQSFVWFLSQKQALPRIDDDSLDILTWIGRTISENLLFQETCKMLVQEAQACLSDLAEERTGRVSSEMLLPMCLGLLPSALLVMLAPVACLLLRSLAS